MKDIKFNFEDLKVYQKSLDFIDFTYKTCNTFPKDEAYRLTSQFIRASTSIALNIAEGAGDTNAQFNRYLQIAIGSVKECVVCSTIAQRQKYITNELDLEIRGKLEELSKMITSLQKYLKNNNTNSTN